MPQFKEMSFVRGSYKKKVISFHYAQYPANYLSLSLSQEELDDL